MERINKQRVFNFYNKKSKWLGIVDYKTLVFGILYAFIAFKIIFLLNTTYTIKIYIYINMILPLVIFILLNIQEESIIDKLKVIICFYIFRRRYINMNFFSKQKIIYVKNVEKYHIEK